MLSLQVSPSVHTRGVGKKGNSDPNLLDSIEQDRGRLKKRNRATRRGMRILFVIPCIYNLIITNSFATLFSILPREISVICFAASNIFSLSVKIFF